jgi:hypothetical protein
MAFHGRLTIASASEFITKFIIVTNTFLTSSSIWMDSNSSAEFLWHCLVFLTVPFLYIALTVQIFELPVVMFFCLLPRLQPIGRLRALLLSLVSYIIPRLSFSGVLRGGKFLGGYRHLKRTLDSTARLWQFFFRQFSVLPKIRHTYKPWFGLFPSAF